MSEKNVSTDETDWDFDAVVDKYLTPKKVVSFRLAPCHIQKLKELAAGANISQAKLLTMMIESAEVRPASLRWK